MGAWIGTLQVSRPAPYQRGDLAGASKLVEVNVSILVAGLAVFLGVHSISIVNDPWRNRMAAALGEWTWKGLYAAASVAGFALIVAGYGFARGSPVALYVPPDWLRAVAMVLLVPVFPLLLAAYLPGRIRAATRHPMLAATQLWAAAHLLANGTLAAVLLFGAFLVWAVLDRASMRHRAQRVIPGLPPARFNDAVAVIGGLALYVAFVLRLHAWLIGVPLAPPT